MEKKLKVLMLNGSPREHGNIALAFQEMEQVFRENGVESENILLGKKDIRGCIACETCRKNKKCVFDDIVNELADKFREADGLVIGSPVYFGSANGTLMSALQRLFYSTSFDKSLNVGASVVSARRSGCTATFDELYKFFTQANLPVATSQYWNNIYGWGTRRGKSGCGRLPGHARSRPEHGFPHEEHCPGESGNRNAPGGRAPGMDKLHPLIP